MEFEQYTIALLVTNPAAPAFSEEERAALQDSHLTYLADLHAAGQLLAVGPLSDEQGELRGLSILNVDPEQARKLKEKDEALRAGVFLVRTMPWSVPAGAMHFTPTFLPRSMADVLG